MLVETVPQQRYRNMLIPMGMRQSSLIMGRKIVRKYKITREYRIQTVGNYNLYDHLKMLFEHTQITISNTKKL